MARYFGDRTAEMLGRLSLNPLRHIDPIGTVLVPGLLLAVGGPWFVCGLGLKRPSRSASSSCWDCRHSDSSGGCSTLPCGSSGGSSTPCSGRRHERPDTKSTRAVRHAAHRYAAFGQLPRCAQELDRTAVPVRMLFLHRRLACAHHRL